MKKLINLALIFFTLTVLGAKTDDDVFKIGKNSSTNNKELKLGGTRVIRSNFSNDKLEFTNDGVNYKAIGAGGSGGGENYNNGFIDDSNPNAESGVTQWTLSGGTFTALTSDPLDGDASFHYTPAAQNDFVESAVLDFNKDSLKGSACEARIEYIGGDENLTFKVIDANDDVIASEVLKVHTTFLSESLFFLCPSDAAIIADANVGQLRYKIENTGASAAAVIKFDKSYAGTLRGLVEVTTPDKFTAKISNTGVVSDETPSDWIDGNCTTVGGSGLTNCPVIAGIFTNEPTYVASVKEGNRIIGIVAHTVSVFEVQIKIGDTGSYTNGPFNIVAHKSGSDAKQSVQVYKSIPRIADNINEYSAGFTGIGAVCNVGTKSPDSIAWVCTNDFAGNSRYIVDHPGGVAVPTVIVASNSNGVTCRNYNANNTRFVVECKNTSGNAVEADFTATVYKSGDDFKMPAVQPVIVGQVANSYAESASKNVRNEHCLITNSGTPSITGLLCDGWVDSVTDHGVGDVSVNFKAGTFADGAACVISPYGVGNRICLPTSINNSEVRINCQIATTAGQSDVSFFISCGGVK